MLDVGAWNPSADRMQQVQIYAQYLLSCLGITKFTSITTNIEHIIVQTFIVQEIECKKKK
jgi:uncharacterized membrane protein